jgi:hypothetical protein
MDTEWQRQIVDATEPLLTRDVLDAIDFGNVDWKRCRSQIADLRDAAVIEMYDSLLLPPEPVPCDRCEGQDDGHARDRDDRSRPLTHRSWNLLGPAGARSSGARAATYAPYIKNKTAKTRKSPRPAAKARAAAAPKSAPPPQASPRPAAPAASDELQRLRDELQRVNQEVSKLARVSRPGSEHSQLPEKQELLIQKQDLERKIRALPK